MLKSEIYIRPKSQIECGNLSTACRGTQNHIWTYITYKHISIHASICMFRSKKKKKMSQHRSSCELSGFNFSHNNFTPTNGGQFKSRNQFAYIANGKW